MEKEPNTRTALMDCLSRIFAGTPYVSADTGAINLAKLSAGTGFTASVLSVHVAKGRLSTGAAYRILQLRRRLGWKACGWELDKFVTYRGRAA